MPQDALQRLLHRFEALAVVGAGLFYPPETMPQIDTCVVHETMQGRECRITARSQKRLRRRRSR
jgi:hypothetical protein